MHRFYCQNANFQQKSLTITDTDEIHHIKDVLRLKKGAVIQIFNGRNQEANVTIEAIGSAGVQVSVQSVKEAAVNSTKIILACAPPKKDKFEWIIEKCTELGVDEIIPLKTKRSEVIFTDDKAAAKRSRFEKVALNAAKQSKRSHIPVIQPMTDLKHFLTNLDPKGLYLFASLNDHTEHLKEALSKAAIGQSITILIGPEGDFTPEETKLAIERGCVPISLGNTVLKVETAAIATVSFIRLTV